MVTDTASDNARLFIAMWPTPAVQRALHAGQGRWRWPVHGHALVQSAAGRYTPIARYR